MNKISQDFKQKVPNSRKIVVYLHRENPKHRDYGSNDNFTSRRIIAGKRQRHINDEGRQEGHQHAQGSDQGSEAKDQGQAPPLRP